MSTYIELADLQKNSPKIVVFLFEKMSVIRYLRNA